MATLPLNNVISGASKVIGDVLNANKPAEKQHIKLTPKQQVDRFLSMSDADLESIRGNKGEYEYQRYVNAMLGKVKEYYNNGG